MGFYGQFQEKLKKIKGLLERNVILILFFHETELGFKSTLQKGWIITLLFFALLFTLEARSMYAVNSLAVFFIFFGTIVALVSSSSSISGEIGGIADSVLSKSVRRWEYVVSKFLAHIVITSVVYFLTILLVAGILWNANFLPEDLSYQNLFFAISLVWLGLLFFSALGVMFSSLFAKTIFSLLGSIVVWFLLIFIFLVTDWKFLYSPVIVLEQFTSIVEGVWDVEYWKLLCFYVGSPLLFLIASLMIFYQKDL